MIIEHKMKFDIGVDIVSDWMNQASKEDVLKLLEMVKADTFDYLLANYLAKMSETNPAKAQQFVKPFIDTKNESVNSKKEYVPSVGDRIELLVFSSLFCEYLVLEYEVVEVNDESKIFYVRSTGAKSDKKAITFKELNKRLGNDIFPVK